MGSKQRRAQDLTKVQLVELANRVQGLLYVDLAPTSPSEDDPLPPGVKPASEFWNPGKCMEADGALLAIKELLDEYGLVPSEPRPFD